MDDIFESLKTMKYLSEMKKGLKQKPEHIKKRVDKMIGFKQSNYQKETVSKKLSSEWIVTNPKGESIKIKNLRQFCINNNLDQGNMVKVSKGIIKQNKGWKCVKIEA
jgi:hypothetical protein